MSNHFYKFLAKKVDQYFSEVVLSAGDKFHIQFDRIEEVHRMICELREIPRVEVFSFETPAGPFETFCLRVEDVRLLVASTLGNTKPDFLTMLRNKVGMIEDGFVDTAILLVHDSDLDSLVHGMTSFSKEGMPFHLDSIEKDLIEMMRESSLGSTDKKVLEFAIGIKKEEQTYQEEISLFDYEYVLQVLEKGTLSVSDFNKFGMFEDSELNHTSLPAKEFNERLRLNYFLYEKVETSHKFGNTEDLEKLFDEKGAKVLATEEDWRNQNFSEVLRSYKAKQEDKEPEYEEPKKKITSQGLYYWERPDGESKSKQRARNIIIFNPQRLDSIALDFPFSGSMNKYSPRLTGNGSVETTGKKIRVTLKHEAGSTNFYKISCTTSHRFDFKVATVECNEAWLSPFQTSYLVRTEKADSHIQVVSEGVEWILNPSGSEVVEAEVKGGSEVVEIFDVHEDVSLLLRKITTDLDDEELIRFNVKLPTTQLPFALYEPTEPLSPISGFGVWKLKREKQMHFKYRIENAKMKILQGTKETFAQGDFRANLDREWRMISSQGLYFKEVGNDLQAVELEIAPSVKKAYDNLLQYFQVNDLLPSLAYLDEEYEKLASGVVTAYLDEMEKVTAGQSLDSQTRNLAFVGTVELEDRDMEWLFSPLHPLNLAYQLQIKHSIREEEALSDELLKILRFTNLLPYVAVGEKIYKPVEKGDSPEWSIYVDHLLPRYEGSRSYIKKLIQDKIEEFTAHFAFMFTLDRSAPLKVSLINMGDCREILQGIFEFYKRSLKLKVSKTDLLPIELNIYAEKGTANVFEELSYYTDATEISEAFDLNLILDGIVPEELLNIFRDKVHFFVRDVDNKSYEYSHLTFYQMSKMEQTATSSMSEIATGLSLSGMISGVPSVFINGHYKTGFGTKFYPPQDNDLLRLVRKLNAFMTVARTPSNYQEDFCLVTVIPLDNKQRIDRVYDSAHWVTFVEPKVDLSFFKNDSTKDLLLIHYSDQYSSSSGFDAITVTRRSDQYQQLIKDFLHLHQLDVKDETLPKVINIFNAINGNWLLKMLAQHNHFPKEKISILSAVKMALSVLYHRNIIWIPISMEEVLRISGGTGLKQSEGLFSAKNLGRPGSYSDDILMIGIESNEEQLHVHLYPIEVKIGSYQAHVKEKAQDQVKQTAKLLRDFLREDQSFQSKMYRNFFMQLAVVSAEKMKLYEIWPEQNWQAVTEQNIRQRLLNDDYELSEYLTEHIGDGAVICFQRGLTFSNVKREGDVLVIEQPEGNGYAYLLREIEQLKDYVQSGRGDITHTNLLSNTYVPANTSHLEQDNTTDNSDSVKVELTSTEDTSSVNKQEQVYIELETMVVPESVEEFSDKPSPQMGEKAIALHTLKEGESKAPSSPMQILFGYEEPSQKEITWYPTSTDKVMHTNTGIIGTMGTGKTQFTKSLITQLHRNSNYNVNGTPIGILIFDYKGDYVKEDFVSATSANVFRSLYRLPYNPLDLFVTEPIRPLLPMHTCDTLVDTISTAFNLGTVQRFSLSKIIMEAYAQKGIDKSRPDTWSNTAPTMHNVFELYASNEDAKVDSLFAALQTLYNYEVFEPDAENTVPLFDLLNGVTVINLSGFPESIQNLVVAITLDVFYSQMQISGHSKVDGNFREITKMILVDEADNFLSKDFKAIKKILKEGREFGVGTILSTQFMQHFSTSDNEYANYILTWIVHQVAEMSARDIKMIFNTSKGGEENIQNKIRTLEKHYSIVKGIGNQPLWMKDKAFWELLEE